VTVLVETSNTPAAWSARARDFVEEHEACGWSEQSQQERFRQVVAALQPRAGDLLLDVGCGTGALADHLPDDVVYRGFDTAEGMVDRARAERPWLGHNAFTTQLPRLPFDLVACVGCFNLPGGWDKARTFHTIRHLWDTTGCRTLVASLYAGQDDRCLAYAEHEASRCGADLGYWVRVDRWRPNDLLLQVRR
jgi:SAM-dependent methyltransferase